MKKEKSHCQSQSRLHVVRQWRRSRWRSGQCASRTGDVAEANAKNGKDRDACSAGKSNQEKRSEGEGEGAGEDQKNREEENRRREEKRGPPQQAPMKVVKPQHSSRSGSTKTADALRRSLPAVIKIESDSETDQSDGDVVFIKQEHHQHQGRQHSPLSSIRPQAGQLSRKLTALHLILQQFKLSTTLPHHSFTRKPKLKFRPPPCTVLNLNSLTFTAPLEEQVELEDLYFLHYALTFAKKTVVITGAGVSVHSGIPDFRSSEGLFQGLANKSTGSGKNLFDYNVFRSPESMEKFENMIEKLYHLSTQAQPSPFHHLINDISKQGRLLRSYTQNIDCLDTQLDNLQTMTPLTFSKTDIPPTVQLHGSIKSLNCSKCSHITELTPHYFTSKLIRPCPSCEELNVVRAIAGKRTQNSGILRPRIVLYNEFHPDGEVIGSITERDLKSKPDCLIVTGTTLKIPGVRRLVKEMAKVVHANNGYVIWINIDEPPQSVIDYVEYFDLVVVGDCQLIPGLVRLFDYLDPFQSNPKPKTAKIKTPKPTQPSKASKL